MSKKDAQKSDKEHLQGLLEKSKLDDRFKVANANTIECIKHKWASLCGALSVMQAPRFECLPFDPFSLLLGCTWSAACPTP